MNEVRYFISLGLILVWALAASSGAHSWEADTHYGLVKWLAYKAGFSLKDAEIVAAGSESADEAVVLDAFTVSFLTKYRSTQASHHIQRHHFPSGGYIPSQPKNRKVFPGVHSAKNMGNRWVRQEIKAKGTGIDRNTQLYEFGASLHPLGDSWAHQGEPDTIFVCPDDLVWSHPADRGGWFSHDADLTHLHRDDTLKTAESMFEFMHQFLTENPIFWARTSTNSNWEDLKGDVENFAKAYNVGSKYEWFTSFPKVWNSFTTYPCFLPKLNLRGRASETCSPAQQLPPAVQARRGDQPAIERGVPEEMAQLAEKFLKKWIVTRKLNDAIESFVDVGKVTNRLAEATPVRFAEVRNRRFRLARKDPRAWMRTLLAIWFARDHGLINALGHGMPEQDGFNYLRGGDFAKIRFESLPDAIHIPGRAATYLLAPVELNDQEISGYLITFKFWHIPRDTMMLLAEKIDGQWKISGFYWWII